MDYKKYHEEFMHNLKGTTSWETFSFIYPTFFNIFIATNISSMILDHLSLSKFKSFCVHFFLDFLLIIIPMILSMTIFEMYMLYYVLSLELISVLIYFVFQPKIVSQNIPPSYNKETNRYFVTNARTTITMLSIIAILAVDFKIFPRRFAKTETYGYSLMDVGVGLFVFANGIVAPEVKNKTHTFTKSVVSSIPLLILGTTRFFLTKETDYHVPISEYGIHWNFFITLAATKILSSLILIIAKAENSLFISLFTLMIHEFLIRAGLGIWVFSNIPRDNFLHANREGVVSSLGYVGLYFLSVFIGKVLMTSNRRTDTKLSYNLILLSALFLCFTLVSEKYFGISRRLANAAYCFWIIFLGTFMCFLFIICESINRYLYKINRNRNQIFVPLIYEAISYNGLACFLLANVLTGIVNLNIQTLNVNTFYSVIILVLYMFVTCFIMSLLYVKQIKLKLW